MISMCLETCSFFLICSFGDGNTKFNSTNDRDDYIVLVGVHLRDLCVFVCVLVVVVVVPFTVFV